MKYIGYIRVSTDKQGRSGLGLESQMQSITEYVADSKGELIKVYQEVESGKRDNRPHLLEAIRHAQLIGARLVIAKLDRLSRDLAFITTLQKNHVDFAVVDLPGADKFTIHLFGALAEKERSMISERTKSALQAAKKRGVKLGKAKGEGFNAVIQRAGTLAAAAARTDKAKTQAALVAPMIDKLRGDGRSLRQIADELNNGGIPTPRGKTWTAQAVKNSIRLASS